MKKLANSLIIITSLFILQSCDSIADEPHLQAKVDNTLTGYYIYGHEENTFQPCGNQNIFWVNGSDEVLELMGAKYWNLASAPYEEVFVEIAGNFLGKASDGFAADYDGQIHVEKLVLMKKKSESDCLNK